MTVREAASGVVPLVAWECMHQTARFSYPTACAVETMSGAITFWCGYVDVSASTRSSIGPKPLSPSRDSSPTPPTSQATSSHTNHRYAVSSAGRSLNMLSPC